jgi:hypothetical protein
VRIEFGSQKLTSFSGLELLGRFLRGIELDRRIRRAFAGSSMAGDYPVVSMIRLVLTLLWIGGRRLSHVGFVQADPMVLRLACLRRLPHERTLSRWLKQFTSKTVGILARLNAQVVVETLRLLGARRVTVDVDGSVISTGLQVSWAQRGFNPHRRKVPSYYPILAHVAQTGQVFAVRTRPGNVHDGKGSEHFLREVTSGIRAELGRRTVMEFRLDGAFFLRPVLEALGRLDVEYALKVPMHQWLGLKPMIANRCRWHRMNGEISYFEAVLPVDCWDMELPVVIYRRRVRHKTRKNFQLDLFDPNDGHYEYSAVTTNKGIGAVALWNFMAGRGAQEKTIAELKDGLAFDTVPTNHYGANRAWQQLSVLALNLLRRFQIEAGAERRRRSRKRTYLHVLESIKTARFQWLNVAGRLVSTNGTRILRLTEVPAVLRRYENLEGGLRKAA